MIFPLFDEVFITNTHCIILGPLCFKVLTGAIFTHNDSMIDETRHPIIQQGSAECEEFICTKCSFQIGCGSPKTDLTQCPVPNLKMSTLEAECCSYFFQSLVICFVKPVSELHFAQPSPAEHVQPWRLLFE